MGEWGKGRCVEWGARRLGGHEEGVGVGEEWTGGEGSGV